MIRLIIKEVSAKGILSKSKVSDYTINPYVGCEHGCTYCYARFMKRFTGHREEWGGFVDVKINAESLLRREITKKGPGDVWMSGVCDSYQPVEEKYELTRGCLKILSMHGWTVTIQTKSPLVTRDIELLKEFEELKVIVTITTADEDVRKIFEAKAPSIKARIETLRKLHSAGIETCAMIAPILPKAEGLVTQLSGIVDSVLVDRMNYHYADRIYRRHNLEYALTDKFFSRKKMEFAEAFEREKVPCRLLF